MIEAACKQQRRKVKVRLSIMTAGHLGWSAGSLLKGPRGDTLEGAAGKER